MAIFKKEPKENKDKPMQTMRLGGTAIIQLTDKIQYENRLRRITNRIHSSPNIDAILLDIKNDILGLVDAERITIYAVAEGEQEIYSKIKVGDEIKEFRVAINGTSIAGYVACNKTMLNIKDAYDLKELAAIDPKLSFNRDFDLRSGFRTKQVLAVPIIFNNKLMGAMQIINKKTADAFLDSDVHAVAEIAETLAIAFNNQQRMQRKELSKYDILISENMIVPNEIEQAVQIARESNMSVERVLIEQFKLKKSDIGRALSAFYRVPFFEFKPGLPIPAKILGEVDASYLRNNVWVPVKEDNESVIIAIDNPRALQRIDDIKRQIHAKSYRFMVGIQEDILKTIDYFLGAEKAPAKDVKKEDNLKDIVSVLQEEKPEQVELEDSEEVSETDSAVIRAVNQIIIDAYKMGASDIHIEPSNGKKEVLVRVRVDGSCMELQKFPFATRRAIISRIKIMSGLDIAERRKPQDGKIQFKKFGGPDIELRVAILPTAGANEDAVMRILASSKPIPLDNLGMSERNLSCFKKMLDLPYGIVLVVGPTGSGKTTTLHSGLGFINTPDLKIWTAEDPVEITQEGLRQVQVASKVGYTFAAAMRAFLRADPDVIMVGEMRDHETAAIGIEASLTGHLVFSTLHTNSAPETIVRLLDMGIDPFNFADALIGILAQRLVRRLCKECKKNSHLEEAFFNELAEDYGPEFQEQNIVYGENLVTAQRVGCEVCKKTGYKGRMGIHELLVASDEIKRMVQHRRTAEEIRTTAMKEGMTTLKQDGILKVLKGHTDIGEVRAVCIK